MMVSVSYTKAMQERLNPVCITTFKTCKTMAKTRKTNRDNGAETWGLRGHPLTRMPEVKQRRIWL